MSTSRRSAADREFKRRLWLFALLLFAALTVAVVYVVRASRRERAPTPPPIAATVTIDSIRARPHVMFLTADGEAIPRLALAPLDDPGQRIVTDIECVRFHYQNGAGVALGGKNAPGGAWFLDNALKLTRAISLAGVPSRARVAPDGKRAAMTFFVTGDSYDSGGFSTRSYLLDLTDRAARPFHLEEMVLLRNGRRVDAPDINYWGVTFMDDGASFFATVATDDHRYLVRGRRPSNEAVVVHDDVECPSLSPRGERIAFKRRVGTKSEFEWRLAVLDVATDVVIALEAEQRNVDDQVEWLDDDHLLYAIRSAEPASKPRFDVWKLALYDKSAPTLFLQGASSPAVVRQ